VHRDPGQTSARSKLDYNMKIDSWKLQAVQQMEPEQEQDQYLGPKWLGEKWNL